MNIPASTYRIQLHKDFNFNDLRNILDYIHGLGITAIYAAPILKAVPGSMHGYDTTDPHMINPEIGTLDEFKSLIFDVKKRNMSWIQDIVPNHMAFHTENVRLMDVLERGQGSEFANYFDIDWNHHSERLNGKVQVPFLGRPLDQCIADGELKIGLSDKGFTIDYFQTSYPLSVSSWNLVTPGVISSNESNLTFSRWALWKKERIEELVNNDEQLAEVLERIDQINSNASDLTAIIQNQFYGLCYWKETEKEIGYRRFFTVNELICLRMEDEKVFNEYHQFLHQLYEDELIQGIRVDHIDGLRDPEGYLKRLRSLFGKECYIIAEKILESKEQIPQTWSLQGTSGYEFLSMASQLMTNRTGAKELLSFYKELVPSLPSYKELVRINKRMILEKYMAGEWDNLARLFSSLGLQGGFQNARIKDALGSFMIALPVYRIYPDTIPLNGEELMLVNEAFVKAIVNTPDLKAELNYLQSLFTNKEGGVDDANILEFLQRLMQFTGPLMAKGVEDTTFYVYNALISHDEVGDAPSSLGISIKEFHKKMQARQSATPFSLNATATHDTKRGEDSRLRLNALCDFPRQWIELVTNWMKINQKFHKRTAKGILAPEVNDEYFIYQAILGGFPEDFEVTQDFLERVQVYFVKVLREAKVNSDWAVPDEEYEEACLTFIRQILLPESEFVNTLVPFLKNLVALSNRYSLAQSLVKITAPGIPDTYQGAGLWDLSFVDPDNRRPVDYEKRIDFLRQIHEKENESNSVLFSYLEDHRLEGIEKLFVTEKALTFRRENPTLFTDGSYLPLQSTGKDTVTISYSRNKDGKWALLVIPLRAKTGSPLEEKQETDDELILPEGAPELWKNVFTGEVYQAESKLNVADCCKFFPVALLTNI